MKGALTVDAVVEDGRVRVVDEAGYRLQAQAAAKGWGDGVPLKIRIEPADEAVQFAQFKYLFGYVFRPVADVSGHTEQELCLMAKAQFMPEGKVSLTELNYEEMDVFTKASEQWLRMEMPEAFRFVDAMRGAA